MSEKYLNEDGLEYFLSKLDSRYAAQSSLSSYLPLTGGTLSGSTAPILTIKRTTAASGAFIDYKASNQDAKLWRLGMGGDEYFTIAYSSNNGSTITNLIRIAPSGEFILNNNIALQWKNASGTNVDVIRLNKDSNLIFNVTGGRTAFNSSVEPYSSLDSTYNLGRYATSTDKARWKNLYLTGIIGKDNASYGLSLPTMSSWTANRTIATEDYVNNAISSSITTVLNTPV